MSLHTSSTHRLLSVLIAALVVACGVPYEEEPTAEPGEIGSTTSAIILGDEFNPENTTHVMVDGKPNRPCSAELYTNEWLVTARHCIEDSRLTDFRRIKLQIGSQSRETAKLVAPPNGYSAPNGWDLVLLRADRPFVFNGQTSGLVQEYYPGVPSDLLGLVATCYGYGMGTVTGTGRGILRKALLPITSTSAREIELLRNTAGQALSHGDSGSGCYATVNGRPYLTGVSLTAAGTVPAGMEPGQALDATAAYQLPGSVFRSWLDRNDDAQFVSQSVAGSLHTDMSFNATIVMRNNGTSTWQPLDSITLSSRSPDNNRVWGLSEVRLQMGESVKPGQEKSFTLSLRTPSVPGVYTFQWQLKRGAAGWFGMASAAISYNVSQGLPPPSCEGLDDITCGKTYGCTMLSCCGGSSTCVDAGQTCPIACPPPGTEESL